MNYKITNKWLIVFGALSAQVAIGAFYAWSIFNKAIVTAYGWDFDAVFTTYTISLVTFALSTIISGKVQISKGPRFTALIGGLLYSGGIFLSQFATSPSMLYVTYGLMAGAGVGFVYVCPLSTLVKWFPEKKGAITGLAVSGFAIGGFVFKFVFTALLGVKGQTPEVIQTAFATLGLIYAVMTIGGALLLDVPSDAKEVSKVGATAGKDYTRKEMLRTSNFYKLLFSDFFALMPGLLLIGIAKDIGTDFAGLNAETAAGIVAIIALFNAAGRLASGTLADKLGPLNVYRSMYVVTIISLAVLAFVPLNYPIFLAAILGVVLGYGSFLSLVPTITGMLFGSKNFSANYSLIFQAYGVAAIIGLVVKKTNKAGITQSLFMVAMATAIIGLIIASLIKEENYEVQEQKESKLSQYRGILGKLKPLFNVK